MLPQGDSSMVCTSWTTLVLSVFNKNLSTPVCEYCTVILPTLTTLVSKNMAAHGVVKGLEISSNNDYFDFIACIRSKRKYFQYRNIV